MLGVAWAQAGVVDVPVFSFFMGNIDENSPTGILTLGGVNQTHYEGNCFPKPILCFLQGNFFGARRGQLRPIFSCCVGFLWGKYIQGLKVPVKLSGGTREAQFSKHIPRLT